MGTGYAVAQQIIRQSADDPQIQIARDAAHELGQDKSYVIPSDYLKVDMDVSLAPFTIVFDDTGETQSTTGYLDGRTPAPPLSIFDRVREEGEYRFSWEPAPGVRVAAVMVRFDENYSGFVLAGKSLQEAEVRIGDIGTLIIAAWAVLGVILLIMTFAMRPREA
ncbi:MAG: hypothetical protein RLY66_261 [Candidatus Parcubacteria bacterium]